MKYWQNEETGMCCAVAKQPSPRHYEISKEAYDLHESGTTTLAVDVGQAGVLESEGNPCCPVCGSENLEEVTTTYKTQLEIFVYHRCLECGHIPRKNEPCVKL